MRDISLLPRAKLEKLQREVKNGNASALEAFWQEIGQQGTPLIEPIPGDNQNSFVTFIWRVENEDQTVAVVSDLSGRSSVEEMERLQGTDVCYKTYRVRNDTRESYQISIAGNNVIDPFNPHTHRFPDNPEVGFIGWDSSVLVLPEAPAHPWSTQRAGIPRGRVIQHRIHSNVLDNDYRFWVYTPPDYKSNGAPNGFLLVLDGWFYLNLIPTPTTLDNLYAAGRLPPLVAIMVGDPFDNMRQRDLACYPPFVDFLTSELLPWARQNYHLSDDPSQNTIVGVSLGGLMAAFIALYHSDVFSNVLSQSGYFGWRAADDEEDMWIVRQYIASPKRPLQFYIEAGLLETHHATVMPGWNNILVSARYMRDVLRAKGYAVHYSEFSGGHNPMNWPGTLANGLLALLK